MKNRTRKSCTSGSLRDEDGNILIYSAVIDGVGYCGCHRNGSQLNPRP